jgi:hypothetical protein
MLSDVWTRKRQNVLTSMHMYVQCTYKYKNAWTCMYMLHTIYKCMYMYMLCTCTYMFINCKHVHTCLMMSVQCSESQRHTYSFVQLCPCGQDSRCEYRHVNDSRRGRPCWQAGHVPSLSSEPLSESQSDCQAEFGACPASLSFKFQAPHCWLSLTGRPAVGVWALVIITG